MFSVRYWDHATEKLLVVADRTGIRSIKKVAGRNVAMA